MERIEQYGLQWIVRETTGNYVFLKQGTGLIFSGIDYVNIFWGPCVDVSGLHLDTNIDRAQRYRLPESQWFFTSYCRHPEELQWYNKLHNGFQFAKKEFKESEEKFFKKVFKLRYKYWRMSLTTATGSKEDAQIVARVLGNAQQFSMLYPNMYVDYSKGHPFLYVNSLIYRRLPDVWTIPDLYELDKDYYDNYKQKREYLWYSIAEARAQHKPIKITAYDYTDKPYIYTEQEKYGIALPSVLEERTR